MRKKRQGIAEEWVDLVAHMPWWLGVVLAIVSYFFMRWLAAPDVVAPGVVPSPATTTTGMLTRALATVGQFLVPIACLIGAALSAIKAAGRSRISLALTQPPVSKPEPPPEPVKPAPEPRPADLYDDWKKSGEDSIRPPDVDTSRWSLELLKALEWKRFEHVCAGYFEELKFRAKTVRAGPDGGVDIHLYAEGVQNPGIIVQCKAWKSYKVGVKPVRELLGVMTADNVAEGIFVTTSTYTGEARQFAMGKNMHLIDGGELLVKLLTLPSEAQQSLLRLATEGDYYTPTCASCGIKLVPREPAAGGAPFWGCRNYPKCRTTMSISKAR